MLLEATGKIIPAALRDLLLEQGEAKAAAELRKPGPASRARLPSPPAPRYSIGIRSRSINVPHAIRLSARLHVRAALSAAVDDRS
jgi:hypothetical protein